MYKKTKCIKVVGVFFFFISVDCVKKLGPVGHAIILYMLFAMLIYVPTGLLSHLYFFKGLNVSSGILNTEGLTDYVWIMIAVYCSAPIFYIIFAGIYYRVWRKTL